MLVINTLRFGLVFGLAVLGIAQLRAFLPEENTRNGNCNSTACHLFIPQGGLTYR